MYNIKDALKSGTSKEQLLKDYEAALAEAQAELDAEEAAMAGLDEARLDAVCAVLDYAVALGACKETDITDELINLIVDAVKKEEKELVRKVKFMTMFAPMPKVKVVKEPVASTKIKDVDALEAFLKGL